jgi:hypothetical protein
MNAITALRNLHENLSMGEAGAAFARADQLQEVIGGLEELMETAVNVGILYEAGCDVDDAILAMERAVTRCKGEKA